MEEKKNNNGLIVLIILLSLCVLCLGGYVVYDKVLSKGNESSETKLVYKKDFNIELEYDGNFVKKYSVKKTNGEIVTTVEPDESAITAVDVKTYTINEEKDYYVIVYTMSGGWCHTTGAILDNQLKVVYTSKDFGSLFGAQINSDNIMVYNDSSFKVLSLNGKELYASKKYGSVIGTVKDYVLVDENKTLKLVDKDGKETIIIKLNDDEFVSFDIFEGCIRNFADNGNGLAYIKIIKYVEDEWVSSRIIEYNYKTKTIVE